MTDSLPSIPSLWTLLQPRRHAFATRTALSTAGGAWSTEEIYRAAESLAPFLERAGVTGGRTVALALPNAPAFLPTLLALWKLEASVALVSPRYAESELSAVAAGGGVSAFLATASHAGLIAGIVRAGRTVPLPLVLGGEPIALAVREDPPPVPSRPPALLKFTSGSTGEPKGIALDGDSVEAEGQNIVRTLGLTPDDRILAGVPLFHSYGFDLGVMAGLFSGAALHLEDYFIPRRMNQDLGRGGISVYLGVPDHYRRWIESASPLDAPLPRVRYLLSCTAPLSAETIQAFHRKFHMPICQHYGSSETGGVTTHVPGRVLDLPHSVGVAMRGVDLRVVDPSGRDVPSGEEGEIAVAGRAVARGYVMGAPKERDPFAGETFRTGDLAVRDAEGFVHLRGRLDQILNVGGLKVSPEEVRRALESHPAVREAAVLGIPGDLGDAVAAMIAVREPVSEKEILAHCYRHLADYKVPRHLVVRDALPRGPSGKVRVRSEDFDLQPPVES